LASAAIHGDATAELRNDYPFTANLKVANIALSKWRDLLGSSNAEPPAFDAAADAQLNMSGPAMRIAEWNGTAQVTRLVANSIPEPGAIAKPLIFRNEGPLSVSLDHGAARINSFTITGPQSHFEASGTASLNTRALNLKLDGHANLEVLQSLSRDVSSSGNVTLGATVAGSMDKPLVNGSLELRNATMNYASVPNGITNANGVIRFNGSSASIRNLTAQTGGGTLTLSGYAANRDGLRFEIRANANNVRVRPQQGVGIVLNANLNLAGSIQQSLLAGSVTWTQLP